MENLNILAKNLDDAFNAYYINNKKLEAIRNYCNDLRLNACDINKDTNKLAKKLASKLFVVLNDINYDIEVLSNETAEQKKIYDELLKQEQDFIKSYKNYCLIPVSYTLNDESTQHQFNVKYYGKIKDFNLVTNKLYNLLKQKVQDKKLYTGWTGIYRRITCYYSVINLNNPITRDYNDFYKFIENL